MRPLEQRDGARELKVGLSRGHRDAVCKWAGKERNEAPQWSEESVVLERASREQVMVVEGRAGGMVMRSCRGGMLRRRRDQLGGR